MSCDYSTNFLCVFPFLLVATYCEAPFGANLQGPYFGTRLKPSAPTELFSKQKSYPIDYQIKFNNITQTSKKTRLVKECCKGYVKTELKTCIPGCLPSCVGGTCIAPNTCKCEVGYRGPTCNVGYQIGKYGPDWKICKCKNGATCDPENGQCYCMPGFKGLYCDQKCPPNYWGQNCTEPCQCINKGVCNHTTGECSCQSGYTGPLCENTCPTESTGDSGERGCPCQNGGKCDPSNKSCICAPGYFGPFCANKCPHNKWGMNCSQTCDCFNFSSCNHVNGNCECCPGFTGRKCTSLSVKETLRQNSSKNCPCSEGKVCLANDGSCVCNPGWKGANSTQRNCPKNYYGEKCTKICDCKTDNTELCDTRTGDCLCKAGWNGRQCADKCLPHKWGKACANKCNCENNNLCLPNNGTCIPAPGKSCSFWSLDSQCQVVTAQMVVVLCVIPILLTIITALLMYYGKRMKKLRIRLAQVQCTTAPLDSSVRDQFENLSYVTEAAISGSTENLLSNNEMTRNNLQSYEPINLGQQRLRPTHNDQLSSSVSRAYGTSESIQFNTNTGFTNSNLYEYISGFKEHGYDEIEILKPEVKYDCLNHSRAETLRKFNYQNISLHKLK